MLVTPVTPFEELLEAAAENKEVWEIPAAPRTLDTTPVTEAGSTEEELIELEMLLETWLAVVLVLPLETSFDIVIEEGDEITDKSAMSSISEALAVADAESTENVLLDPEAPE